MGQISERPPRLNDDDTEDDPTRVSADADPTAIESGDDITIASASPPSLRALGIAPVVVSKPIPPLPPMAPIVEPDGDPTEAGVVVRLAPVLPLLEREEHTVKMPAVPAAAPAAAEPPASSKPPPIEEDPAAEMQVPGLGPDLRAKWLAIAALALVMVWIGGAAVGRMSAPRTEAKPVTSSAIPSNDVPALPAPIAEPPPSNDEPVASASLNIAPTTHVTPPERRAPVRAAPPPPAPRPVVRSRAGATHTGGIVRETPF